MFNHITQRQLAKCSHGKGLSHRRVPCRDNGTDKSAFAQSKRRGSQPQQAGGFIWSGEDLLILALFIVTNTVAFIDNQQRKFTLKGIKLRVTDCAAKYNFTVALFALAGGKISASSPSAIFSAVATSSLACQHQRDHAPAAPVPLSPGFTCTVGSTITAGFYDDKMVGVASGFCRYGRCKIMVSRR